MRFDVLVVWTSVFILLFAIIGVLPKDTVAAPITETGKLLALTGYFSESIGRDELREKYLASATSGILGLRSNEKGSSEKRRASEKVSILIVPGHDDKNTGALFNGLREVDLNRELAVVLSQKLSVDDSLYVLLASTNNGWHPTLETFFEEQQEAITAFEQAHKAATAKLESVLHLPDGLVEHNQANEEVVHSLYGINKFANDSNFDIVLHIHFNDYPGRPKKKPGKYEGFAIYTPLVQFSNGRASLELARSLFAQLLLIQPVSTLPVESSGIIEGGELIAVGAFNTVDAIALLIEYGFIYEPEIFDPTLRGATFENMAEQTVRGLQLFLSGK